MTWRFIGGASRSGTSAIVNMLDAHPDVLGLRDVFILPGNRGRGYYGLRGYIEGEFDGRGFRSELDFYVDILNKRLRQHRYQARVERSELERLAREHLRITPKQRSTRVRRVGRFIEAFHGMLREKTDTKHVAEKTAPIVAMLDDLYAIAGDGLRFVHTLRDPRDVFASNRARGRPFAETPEAFERWYRSILEPAKEAFAGPAGVRCLHLSLPDTQAYPRCATWAVLAHLELLPSDKAEQARLVGRLGKKLAGHDVGNLARWKRDLKPSLARDVWQRCGGLYEELRAMTVYPPEFAPRQVVDTAHTQKAGA